MITEVAPPPRTAEEVLAGVRATGAVSNIGLMQDQMMTLYSGLAAIISGFMLIAAGAVVKAIETRKE
ncbi:MAG: hypothetical protein DI537_55980 [Stutzerimonas stutzeri]|nr:MAG: hypothetical protein DI537_55980 [Stutzerimonas stutzeri]